MFYLSIFMLFFGITIILLVLLLPPERMTAEIQFDSNHQSVKWLKQTSYCNFPILIAILLFM